MLRSVFEDPDGARERAERAASDMARLHAPLARAPFLLERLKHVAEPPEIQRARHKPDRPWTAVRSADRALSTGPDVESPTSYGFLSRVVRRIVLRVARHYIEHQEQVQSSLLEGVHDLEARLRAEVDAARYLESEVDELRERLEQERARRRSVEQAPVGRPTGGGIRRVRSYAGLFGANARVLAVGREAEELIDSLAGQGLDAFALDSAGPLDFWAVLDGIELLADSSLGGILTVKLFDHLSTADLQRFLELARRKLDAGGVLVASSEADARGWAVSARSGPGAASAPEALLELCRSTGFEQAYVLFPSGAPTADDDESSQGEFAIVASVVPGSG